MTQYIQHVSGQGEKWEVLDASTIPQPIGFGPKTEYEWYVRAKIANPTGKAYHILPVSEYCLCSAPDVWTDVTAECREGHFEDNAFPDGNHPLNGYMYILNKRGLNICAPKSGYRLRKIIIAWFGQPAREVFIVEKNPST